MTFTGRRRCPVNRPVSPLKGFFWNGVNVNMLCHEPKIRWNLWFTCKLKNPSVGVASYHFHFHCNMDQSDSDVVYRRIQLILLPEESRIVLFYTIHIITEFLNHIQTVRFPLPLSLVAFHHSQPSSIPFPPVPPSLLPSDIHIVSV